LAEAIKLLGAEALLYHARHVVSPGHGDWLEDFAWKHFDLITADDEKTLVEFLSEPGPWEKRWAATALERLKRQSESL